MKKLYLLKTFLLACLFSIVGGGMAWAETVTDTLDFSSKEFNLSNEQPMTSWSPGKKYNVSVSFNSGTNTSYPPKYYTSGTAVRVYGGNYFTVTAPEGKVLKRIVITFGTGDKTNAIKVSEGTYDTKTKTWTSSTAPDSVKFTINGTKGHRRIKALKITYGDDGGGESNLQHPDLSFSASTAAADLSKPAEFKAPTLTKPDGLTVTYSSSDEAVATVNANTGAVTLVGVGSTTITASSEENETYYAGSASYTLNVIDTTPIAGLAGLRAKVTSTTAQQYTVNVTDAVVTYVNGKNAYLQTAEGAVLCFGTNALGLTQGKKINGQIVVNAMLYNGLLEVTAINTKGANVTTAEGELAPQVVTVAEIIANPTAYESRYVTIKDVQVTAAFNNRNATVKQGEDSYALRQNVVIDVPLVVNLNDIIDVTGFPSIFGKTLQFSVYEQAHIVTKAEEITLTISEAGYATFYSDKALVVPAGMEATTVTAANNDGTLTMGWEYQAGNVVPAGTAVLLRGAADSYPTYLLSDYPVAAPEGNMLHGSVEAATTEGGAKYYKLTYATIDSKRVLGFFWGAEEGAAFTNAAGKAYLALPAEAAANGYRLDGGDVTGIGQIATDVQGNGQVYSISGVRMDGSKRLPAGIYVINGRKVIVK